MNFARRLLLFCLGCLLFFGTAVNSVWAAPTTTVEKVRLGQHKTMTRVVIESDRPINPKHFTLPNPDRLVLDLAGRYKFDQNFSKINYPVGSIVKKVRKAQYKPNVVRMVFELNAPVKVTKFNIPAGSKVNHRLVLDLSPDKSSGKASIPVVNKASDDVISAVDFGKKSDDGANKHSILKKKAGGPLIVMIDPGHGGRDPGAVTRSKTYEKHIVLAVAKELRKELNKQRNVKAYMTRDRDVYVQLGRRVSLAQEVDADIFVSIHADSHRNRQVKGGSVYVLSERSSDREAARLAAGANRGDEFAGLDISHESKDVQGILINLTQRDTMNKSAMLAADILKYMDKATLLRKRKPQFAGFRVLKAPEIPSVLVELAYISNRDEERKLKRSSHQQKMAKAIAKGIMEFAKEHVHH